MKVNLYIGSRKVKTVKVKNISNMMNEVIKRDYRVTIINQKDLFNKFIVTTYLRPVSLLSEPTDKEVDMNCIVYGGANIE